MLVQSKKIASVFILLIAAVFANSVVLAQKIRLYCAYRPSLEDLPGAVIRQVENVIMMDGFNPDYIHFKRKSWNEIAILHGGEKTWWNIYIDCLEVD
jgi:hypothetical protein